jgi:hypothetical protein
LVINWARGCDCVLIPRCKMFRKMSKFQIAMMTVIPPLYSRQWTFLPD